MIKFLITPIIFLVFYSCTNDFPTKTKKINNHSEPKSIVNTSIIKDTALIKSWLTKVIIDYVNSEDLKAAHTKMQSILTKNYYNYKQDAINLEYSDDMTEAEFHQKWKAKYNTKYVGKGGFFISAQDNGAIDIPVCKYLRSLGDSAQIFHVVIRDLSWKINYVRDITIVTKNNKLFIDDVIENE